MSATSDKEAQRIEPGAYAKGIIACEQNLRTVIDNIVTSTKNEVR